MRRRNYQTTSFPPQLHLLAPQVDRYLTLLLLLLPPSASVPLLHLLTHPAPAQRLNGRTKRDPSLPLSIASLRSSKARMVSAADVTAALNHTHIQNQPRPPSKKKCQENFLSLSSPLSLLPSSHSSRRVTLPPSYFSCHVTLLG